MALDFHCNFTQYIYLAASSNDHIMQALLPALNLSCSGLVTKEVRQADRRPRPKFPTSPLLSATLLTYFEGSTNFIRQALSPFYPSDYSHPWNEVTTIKKEQLFPPIIGTLL